MIDWHGLTQAAPEIVAAAERLLRDNEVAFLATVAARGRPRIHPFVPKVLDGKLLAFVLDSSPKLRDLRTREQYAIHTLPGDEDEECYLSGQAVFRNEDAALRDAAASVMGFATGVDEHHILFEFLFDRALWTRWLDFGTPNHRPSRVRWQNRPNQHLP